MIFYFSGTGNSEHIAKELCTTDETIVSMGAARRDSVYTYTISADESVGFVFPVYFFGLPDTVRIFVKNLKLSQTPKYVYAVIACGASIAGAGNLLAKLLKNKEIRLDSVFPLKMPDNYVIMYDVTTEAEEKPILQAAEKRLEEIRNHIAQRKGTDTGSLIDSLKTSILYPFYDVFRNTKKFRTNNKCVGCGVCASRCPARAIELIDGQPAWTLAKCDHCMSCIRCNAIEYGKRTEGKYRYRHPDLRKKKTADAHSEHENHGNYCKPENGEKQNNQGNCCAK